MQQNNVKFSRQFHFIAIPMITLGSEPGRGGLAGEIKAELVAGNAYRVSPLTAVWHARNCIAIRSFVIPHVLLISSSSSIQVVIDIAGSCACAWLLQTN